MGRWMFQRPFLLRGMTPQQQRFVDEYLTDLNATAAYQRAGYKARGKSAENNASRLLGNAGVKAAIAAALEARKQRTLITADEVIQGLKTEATLMGEGSSHSARVQAWVALGKHLALFVDRKRIEGTVTLEIVEEIVDGGGGGSTPKT